MEERINRICEIQKTNQISLDKNFNWKYIEKTGFISDNEPLMNKFLDALEMIEKKGINQGFTRDMKEDMKIISKAFVKILKVYYPEDRERLEKSTKNIIEHYTEDITMSNNTVKKSLMDAISNTEKALEIIFEMDSRGKCLIPDMQKNNMKTLGEKLGELKAEIAQVVDTVSNDAVEAYQNVKLCILDVRNSISANMVTSRDIERLNEAKVTAAQWKAKTANVAKKELAKQDALDKCVIDEDEIDCIGKTPVITEYMDNFDFNLRRAKSEIEEKEAKIEEKIAALRQIRKDLEENEEKSKQLFIELQNYGDEAACEERADELAEEEDRLKEEEEELIDAIEELKSERDDKKEILKRLGKVIDILDKYKNKPIELAIISDRIDFRSLSAMLIRDFVDEETIENANQSVISTNIAIDTLKGVREEEIKSLRKSKAHIDDITLKDKNRETRKQRSSLDRLKERFGNDKTPLKPQNDLERNKQKDINDEEN